MESLIAKDTGKTYTPHPTGACRVICADVFDEGYREGPYGTKRQVRLVFLSEILDEETGEMMEHSEWFTLSLNEKANLRKFLEPWRGRPFSDEEARGGWDIMKLIGVSGYAQFLHKDKQSGGKKAVISSIMRLPKEMQPLKVPATFKRVKDRQKDKMPVSAGDDANGGESDEEIPF